MTPMSCDGVTLLSLPLLHSLQHSSVVGNPAPMPGNSSRRADGPMSTSLLGRNESWSSFSSLHSLPEPFLCHRTNQFNSSTPRGIPDAFRGIPPINGWHDGGLRPAPPLANGYASEEPQMNPTRNVFVRPSINGPTSYSSARSNDSGTLRTDSGTLRASSVGREIDAVSFSDEDQPTSTTRKKPASDGRAETVRSPSSSRPMNAVLGQLVRAKSVTSKTLRRFGPKFSGSTKSVVNSEPSASVVKNAIVRRSSSIAQRFRALRPQPSESHLGVGTTDGNRGFHSLRRGRERSPLAAEDTTHGRVPNSLSSVVAGPKLDRAASQRDPLRRVLFGATAAKDGPRKIPESSSLKNRLSFHGRDRATSCGDSAMMSGFSTIPVIRPRSTEPPSRSVRIEPTMCQINASSPIMIESSRSGNSGSSPLGAGSTYDSSRFSSARSPRMASPESSSLSSGSPASVFSGVPLCGSSRHVMRTSNQRLPSPAASMSDLSLWEMPKLDIDLIDQMFVGHLESGFVPIITQNSSPVTFIPPVVSVDSSDHVMSDSCNDATDCKLSTATEANWIHGEPITSTNRS